MTTARIAIRILATQALKGADGNRPTIAEGRIFDSRISALQPEDFTDDAKPTVIVLTDSDEGPALSDQNGGPPFNRAVDLVFDIGMLVAEKAEDDADGYLVGYPDTDARLEMSIDLLETQIIRHLSAGLSDLSILFQRLVRVVSYESHRHIEPDSVTKMARRVTTLKCTINDDIFPTVIDYGDDEDAPDLPAGLDLLPEPLRTVAKLMPSGSSAAEMCAAIAESLANISAPAFTGADISADAGGQHRDEHSVAIKADPPQS